MPANDKQVGGQHYQVDGKVQHWDLVYEYLEGDYLLGNATKYIFRCGKKGGHKKAVEDLKKAIHYLEKAIEKIEDNFKDIDECSGEPTSAYVNQG